MSRGLRIALVFWGIVLLWWFWTRGWDKPMAPIEVADGSIVVRNLTDRDWTEVQIWVNEFYSGTVRSIPARGFARESIRRFAGPYGRTINPAATAIDSVVVTAKDSSGEPVRITLGSPKWH